MHVYHNILLIVTLTPQPTSSQTSLLNWSAALCRLQHLYHQSDKAVLLQRRQRWLHQHQRCQAPNRAGRRCDRVVTNCRRMGCLPTRRVRLSVGNQLRLRSSNHQVNICMVRRRLRHFTNASWVAETPVAQWCFLGKF